MSKKTIKRIVSLFIGAIVLVMGTTSAAFASEGENASLRGSATPIVYVSGQGGFLYENVNAEDSKKIYPLTIPDNYIMNQAKSILPLLGKAVVTGDYDEYCDALYNSVSPLFEEVRVDNNGNPAEGQNNNKVSSVKDRIKNGLYAIDSYRFSYDWRVDPCETADYLHGYIENVLEATGAKRVNLVGRCLASNIVLAYLSEYGGEQIDNCIFYCGCIYGTTECGKIFSGDIDINAECAARYAVDFLDDDSLMNFVKSSVLLLEETYCIDLTAAVVNAIYAKVYENVVPRLLYATFGTMPSYWSMISDLDYNNAKAFLLNDALKYGQLIDKIDHYHYDIQLKTPEIIESVQAQGAKVSVICKYGIQLLPITETSNELCDGTVELSSSSLGAVCAQADGVLINPSDTAVGRFVNTVSSRFGLSEYQQANDCCGYNHVSPDKQVDASTCLLPDNTWIVKNIDHRVFPESINTLMYSIFEFDGHMSVSDNAAYPQFLVYDKETEEMIPMTADNSDTYAWKKSLNEKIQYFLESFFRLLHEAIDKLTVQTGKEEMTGQTDR